MNELLSLMFTRRGYSPEYYHEICQCNHPEPSNIHEMCQLLKQYHDNGVRIVLLTDFDMDGLMCGVIGYAGLIELGFNVVLAHPNVTTGYGFDANEIDDIKQKHPDAAVLLTGDVGITAFEGVARARELGMDVLITDHHVPKDMNVNANVIVDPQFHDDPAYSDICGAHVLYLLLRHYAMHFTPNPDFTVDQIDRLRVFAGFGTISDNMPMLYENRRLVNDARFSCHYFFSDGNSSNARNIPGCETYKRAFLGLHILLREILKGKRVYDVDKDYFNEEFLSFSVIPLFNSIKRMDGDTTTAYDLFFGTEKQSVHAIGELIALNERRKLLVEVAYTKMCSADQPYSPYVYIVDTLPGLCGLLAQEALKSTDNPVLVVIENNGSYSGSGRSPEWYPFLKNAGSHPGWEPAGHEAAFGIKFRDSAALDEYYHFIEQDVAAKKPTAEQLAEQERPDFTISATNNGDIGISLAAFKAFIADMKTCRPFGRGFPKPKICLCIDPYNVHWTYMSNGKHAKAQIKRGFSVVLFNQGEFISEILSDSRTFGELVIMGTLEDNGGSVQFNGEVHSLGAAQQLWAP